MSEKQIQYLEADNRALTAEIESLQALRNRNIEKIFDLRKVSQALPPLDYDQAVAEWRAYAGNKTR